ncbi:putative disease resistance protein RGA3 isoform X1 [Amaranthus tricolor]|uniref:putative disease resistance protein RGA3 isoform X1 n=1 Tax=Amaranthus tricolor TaxID=29722 RepID=UPI00258A0B17|nr:putative disease resistance protein RGA3 isoform X1 [Amaranthus tricolor]
MVDSILYGLSEEALKKLGGSALNEIASAWGFKAELDKLHDTITTVKNVLLDAEKRQADELDVRGWIERLTLVVYAADDLFDELNTIASRRQLMGENSISRKVRAFFSHSNHIALALKVSRKIRKIREKLDAIDKDGKQLKLVQSLPLGRKSMKKREQSYSFVDAQQVIGRDADKNAILDLLLASSSNIDPQNEVLPVPVISIVGIGGQGKTTLAQLVYNDPKVEKSFNLRLWVCISEVLDFKGVLEKILRSATKAETPKLDIEQLQAMLREAISGKKYFLVMDDVWDDKREKWLKLRDLLKMGGEGSKILVTTRSKEVARIMDSLAIYELQGLTNEKSWELFVNMAFEPGQAQQKPRLVKLGKEIVKRCANVPLAIRTLGSLLYGKEEKKWSSLMNTSLAKLSDGNQEVNDILSILKLSYNDLWSPLKNCFAYCALFPKDYEFNKEMLKQLWMAEGFIVADYEGNQSLEDVAEDYFQILLQRCFFQDIKTEELGAIIGCKMHDLMHDLARSVAGAKCKVASLEETRFDVKIIHLSYACRLTSSWKIQDSMRNMQLLRTFLMPEHKFDGSLFGELMCKQLISSFSCLRVLDLHSLWLKTLPDSVGNLIHLRYLNLSKTPIQELPNSITKLLNLQTLNLYRCRNLGALPTGIRKLVNLRSLDVGDWDINLLQMPSGIGKLTLLQKLPLFRTDYEVSNRAKLSELKQLNNLRGELHIIICGNMGNPSFEANEANLISKQGLDKLEISFTFSEDDEVLMEGLKPHSNLRKWVIRFYRGKNFPSWATMDNLSISLPNLVCIYLEHGESSEVPVLSQLCFLKYLYVNHYSNVEYMENNDMINQFSSSPSMPTYTETIFFPSLQELHLSWMDSLKGWWKEDVEAVVRNDDAKEASYLQQGNEMSMLSFSKLSKLSIYRCPKLKTLPLCPNVEELNVSDIDESLLEIILKIATTRSNSSSQTTSRLKKLTLSNAEKLMSLPMHCLHQLSSLTIEHDPHLKSTDTLVEVFARLSSSLRYLKFRFCTKLRSISKGLGHLTALETLNLESCFELDLSPNQQEANEEDEDDMPWKAFKTNLRSLKLFRLPKLVDFPSGFRHLTNLRSLEITYNVNLRELPEWISCVSSLINMKLYGCPELTCLPDGFRNLTNLNRLMIGKCSPILTERCKGPNGSDWLKIQHIPFLIIDNQDGVSSSEIYSLED